jgi:transposase
MNVGAVKALTNSEEPSMQTITTIGLNIAKSVFQVHGVDAAGRVVIPSSHNWCREVDVLSFQSTRLPPF